ncbi:MAG: hypothetical protein H7X70_03790 [Candidatus Kapabacteria bacterium]|nr:hypothetical protein [Candidatus Kapabacteria bacterium]
MLSIAVLVGCSENPVNILISDKNSFTMNGSGYTEAKFAAFNLDTASNARELSGPSAFVVFSGTTTKLGEVFTLTLTTKTTSTGSYQINGLEGTTAALAISKGGTISTYFATSGSITIDTWASVNGRVTGRFDCSLALTSDPTISVLQITAGKFDAKRSE